MKVRRQDSTINENPGADFETGGSMQFMAHKQAVIEFNQLVPSKVIQIEDGVELVEKGKSVKGNSYSVQGKYKLDEYRKLNDTRQQ